MREITKAEMLRLYEAELIQDPLAVGNKIYARRVKSEDNEAEVVWCNI